MLSAKSPASRWCHRTDGPGKPPCPLLAKGLIHTGAWGDSVRGGDSMGSDHIHHLRKLRNGKYNRYECMDCGKRLRILSGVLVANTLAEAEAYWQRKRE